MEVKPADEAFLESDPLYREYKEAQTRVPKYQQLDVKLYVLLRDDQLESLARLTRGIMKNRTSEYKTERITKNTIIRALIDNLSELTLDVQDIPDEAELTKRIADAIRAKWIPVEGASPESKSDDELQKLLTDCIARIEEYKGHGEGRFYNSVQGWGNSTLDELVFCDTELALSLPERAVLDVLINKKIAEDLKRDIGDNTLTWNDCYFRFKYNYGYLKHELSADTYKYAKATPALFRGLNDVESIDAAYLAFSFFDIELEASDIKTTLPVDPWDQARRLKAVCLALLKALEMCFETSRLDKKMLSKQADKVGSSSKEYWETLLKKPSPDAQQPKKIEEPVEKKNGESKGFWARLRGR